MFSFFFQHSFIIYICAYDFLVLIFSHIHPTSPLHHIPSWLCHAHNYIACTYMHARTHCPITRSTCSEQLFRSHKSWDDEIFHYTAPYCAPSPWPSLCQAISQSIAQVTLQWKVLWEGQLSPLWLLSEREVLTFNTMSKQAATGCLNIPPSSTETLWNSGLWMPDTGNRHCAFMYWFSFCVSLNLTFLMPDNYRIQQKIILIRVKAANTTAD